MISRCLTFTALLTALPALSNAQGYDPRWNPNDRPAMPAASAQTSPDMLWREANAYLDRNAYRNAYPYVARCAQMGNVHCEAEMGILLQSNDIGPENDRLAAQWFARAAAQGHHASEYELGAMYEEGGGGLPRDPHHAIALYKASAGQGFAPADLILAVDTELGDGTPRNRSLAVAYAERAGGYMGNLMVRVLANPTTPRFTDYMQLGAYLARVDNAAFAQSWNRAVAPYAHATHGITGETMGNEARARWTLNHPNEPMP